jgi:hypothetical protein
MLIICALLSLVDRQTFAVRCHGFVKQLRFTIREHRAPTASLALPEMTGFPALVAFRVLFFHLSELRRSHHALCVGAGGADKCRHTLIAIDRNMFTRKVRSKKRDNASQRDKTQKGLDAQKP